MKTPTLEKLALLSFFMLIALPLRADILAPGQKAKGSIIGKVNTLETKDGFSAQFWMTDDEQIFSTWAKPGAIRNLQPITHVKRNVPVYLALFIASPGIRNDNSGLGRPNYISDVTFDLFIINPNGIVSLSYPGRVAWCETAPSPGLVYLARDRGTLRFEVIDPLGEYTIIVVLHDNIRKTDLKLARKLELVQ